ncbi:putative trimeric autoransporter, BpaB [Caballeronia humi]|uniref:Trimeric autoransporter, BpaB n=1 Tax=Caballeronia humi TaxID=326474 RepID=A0A158I7A7_9BURK|nr:putative trimeric autoransporter, BpaB [Caballeronia humi]
MKDAGLKTDTSGNVTNAFVAYDDSTKGKVTLAGGTAGTTLANVKAGAADMEAVNLKQLKDAGLTVGTSGNVTNAFVAYDDSTKGKVTLAGGTAGTTLANVKAGAADMEAVNLKQLKDAGLTTDTNGTVTNAFVAYDNAAKNSVTLGVGTAGAQIHQVLAGTADADAVNLKQLKDAGLKTDTNGTVTNAFVAYDDSTKGKVTLAGGTTGTTLANVKAGAADMEAVNLKQLKDAGLTVGTSGNVTNAFVAYDDSTKGKVTLAGGTAGTTLANVKAGAADMEAVNLKQLKDAGLKTDTNGTVTNAFVAYDGPSKTSVTLGGGTAGTQLHNVADATAGTDAVNLKQLQKATDGIAEIAPKLKYIKFGAALANDGTEAQVAQASGTNAVAIGGNAFANNAGALALGADSRATGKNSVAIGIGSDAREDNTVAVGSQFKQRRIVNVANATGNNDAVNLGQVQTMLSSQTAQLQTLSQQATTALAQSSSRLARLAPSSLAPEQLIASGPTDKANQIEAVGTDSIAIGLNTHANANNGVAIGSNILVGGVNSVGIGSASLTNGTNAVAIGVNAQAINAHALAIGDHSVSEAASSIAIGHESSIGGDGTVGSIAIGEKNFINNSKNVALGNGNSVTGTGTFVLGHDVMASGNNSVVLGAGSDGSQSNVVSVGAKGSERKIVNVAKGTADTDAVNVAQLNAAVGSGGGGDGLVVQDAATKDITVAKTLDGSHVNFAGTAGARELTGVANGTGETSAATVGQLKPVVTALGGGAKVNTDGSVTGPTYNVQGGTQTDVGTALSSLDTGINTLKDQVNASGIGLVVQDPTSRDITVGAKTDGSIVNVAGTAGNRKVTGVANGDVSATSFDAINGSQLSGVSTSVANALGGGSKVNSDGSISLPTFVVGGTTTHNVGDALSNIDDRVTLNTTEITNLKTTINNVTGGKPGGTPNAVAYDTDTHDKVTLGNAGTPTSLANVADGMLSADSLDAVNGRQLFATNTKVDELGDAIRNVSTTGTTGLAIAPNEDGTPPVATATGSGGIALGHGADTSGKDGVSIGGGSSAGGEGSVALGKGSQATGDNSVALGSNSVADQPNTVSVGSEGAERRVTNVASGVNGTDAVNVNQLKSGLGDVSRNAYSGIAAATALTMIPDVDANKTLSVGVGYGTYKGYSAAALGGTARITQNIKVRVGAGWSSQGTTVGAGAAYQW